jgi:hypothetical protein
MQRFKSPRQAREFLSAQFFIYGHFRLADILQPGSNVKFGRTPSCLHFCPTVWPLSTVAMKMPVMNIGQEHRTYSRHAVGLIPRTELLQCFDLTISCSLLIRICNQTIQSLANESSFMRNIS